ncbi:nucleotidyl cyclase domain-containing protein [Tautonia plasticadhaerens]|uniref:GGDEF domain-containing protein n=1 Tax=Tautonia plasticadhaerens TaxID=2527974 RepID=A0A518GYI7_9BACT|nr:hypothetical protein [Tautonia plasticadhaerens]QDV33651.1 hypothetical protein ElP_15270 [Tautonia plasticadhaerens]
MPMPHRDATITVQADDPGRPPRMGWPPALGRTRACRADRILSAMLDGVGRSTRREEIHDLLLRAARALTGSNRVEVRPVGGPNRVLVSRSSPAPGEPVRLPVRFRGEPLGTLLVSPRGRRPIPPATVSQLESLCAIAALADRLLGREPLLRLADPSLPESRLKPRALLLPILRQLILLARRRREPLTVLAIGLDRPASMAEAILPAGGAGSVDPSISLVLGTLRESDLVVMDDPRTLIAVLPNASNLNAPMIAESILLAAAGATDDEPTAPLAVGVAGLSDRVREADVLLDLAQEALRRARLRPGGGILVADQDSFTPGVLPKAEPVAVG